MVLDTKTRFVGLRIPIWDASNVTTRVNYCSVTFVMMTDGFGLNSEIISSKIPPAPFVKGGDRLVPPLAKGVSGIWTDCL